MMGDVKDRLLNSGAEAILGTDSVPGPVSEVSIAPLVADALKRKCTKTVRSTLGFVRSGLIHVRWRKVF